MWVMAGGRWPHLADASDIRRWAEDRIEARSEFPRWVRTLIDQTNDQVVSLDMRAGKAVDVHGYDGLVEAAKATPFVPAGLSVWELGTGADPVAKANKDYRDRTKDSLGIDKSRAVFVFATPRQWDEKNDWAQRKRAQGIWRDVRAFDASDVEMAFESAPAAHFAFSETVGKPTSGVRTLEDWWQSFATFSQPALTPELVLAGRADQAAELLRLLAQQGRLTTISAPSTDDVIAFVAGTLMTTPEAQRGDLLARTLIVHDAISLRMIESSASLLILLPFEEELRRAAELVRAHHVIFLAPDDTPSDVSLPRLDRDIFASTLQALGVDEGTSHRLARAAHRSIVAFQRDAASGTGVRRRWSLQSPIARRAWLAGSWNERRSGDLEAMAALFGTPYEKARDELRGLATGEDPLFTIAGGAWALVSFEDAWDFGLANLDDFDLSSLEATIQTVLGAVNPALELPAEERWKAGLFGKTRIHSGDLRSGLATTLALCGARGTVARFGSAGPLSSWAAGVIYRLLDRANEDGSGQIWASLSDVLPLLAEAAPDVFLRAIQKGVSGSDPVLKLMFADSSTNAMSVDSPHTGLLWALETVAWSEEHAALAAGLLARLADIDPGGRLRNRPINSLADIFRTWLPQTSLPMARRLAVLGALERDHEEVAWTLMLRLLPEPHAVGDYSHAPRFRPWKPSEEGVSTQEFWDASSAVTQRLIQMAERQPNRWIELVQRLADFPPPERADALTKLSAMADADGGDHEQQQALWTAIDELVRHHRAFADAEWALPTGELEQLASIADRLTPTDPVDAHRWLFNTHLPEIRTGSGTYEERQAEVDAARIAALAEILDAGGIEAAEGLARSVERPGFVGVAAAARGDEELDQRVTRLLDETDPKLASFAAGYSFQRAQTGGWSWLEAQLSGLAGRPLAQARLLQQTDDLAEAWRRAKDLGPDVEAAYWREFRVMGRGSDFPLINEATRALLEHDQVVTAIDLMSLYGRDNGSPVQPDLILKGLERLVEAPPPPEQLQRVTSYELDLLLDRLRASEVDEERLALLEWRLLPARGFQARSPVLERQLSRDPGFFVEILSLCFRPRNDEGTETDPVPEHVANNAYRLLQEWKIVPGSADRMAEVNEAELMAWTTRARELLAAADRTAIGDIYIGHVYAHTRQDDDGTWPTRPVRNAIERFASTEIEDGFQTQTYNNRGTTTRGALDGGPERALSEHYRLLATRIRDEWPRTAAALSSLSDSYESDARRLDEEAERLRQGLDN